MRAGLAGLAGLVLGCSDDASAPPALAIEILEPLAAVQLDPGDSLEVRYVVTGASATVSTDLLAEVIFGAGPTVTVAAGVSADPDIEQSVVWDTTGVQGGVYRLVVEATDGALSASSAAPALVTVGDPGLPPGLLSEGGSGFIVPISLAGSADGSLVLLAQLYQFGLDPVVLGAGTPNEVSLAPAAAGTTDMVVARYAPDGTFAWARRSEAFVQETLVAKGGPSSTVEPASAVCFPDGSCAVLAEVHGSARFGVGEPSEILVEAPIASPSEQALVVLSYAANGDLAWGRELAPQSTNYGVPRLAALPGGQLVISGSVQGVSSPTVVLGAGEPGQTAIAVADCAGGYLAVFEADGQLASAQPFPRRGPGSTGGFSGHISALAATELGELLVAGWFYDEVIFGTPGGNEVTLLAPGAEQRVFLARLDSSGALVWVRTAEAPEETFTDVRELVIRPSDGVALTGVRYSGPLSFDVGLQSQLEFVPGSADGSLFLIEFDSQGHVLWGRDTGIAEPQSYDDRPISGGLLSLEDGGLLLADGFDSSGVTTLMQLDPDGPNPIGLTVFEDTENILVLRYDSEGALLFAFADGGQAVDQTDVQIVGLASRPGGAFTVAAHVLNGPAEFGVGTPTAAPVPTAGKFNQEIPIALATYGADGVLLPTSP